MRKWLWVLAVSLVFLLVGCSSSQDDKASYEEDNTDIVSMTQNISTRKIIYEVQLSIQVSHVNEVDDHLKTLLMDDEWIDYQSIGGQNASYTLRIRTDRLDQFIEDIKQTYVIQRFQKSGTDISLQYQDKTNRMLAIDAELARLIDLYASAKLSDMIIINSQIAHLEVEKQKLNGELLVYDSLVDYSQVNLTVYGSSVVTKSPFFNRLGRALDTGFTGTINFLDGFIMLLATILPFGIFVSAIGVPLYLFIRFRNKKHDLKKKQNV